MQTIGEAREHCRFVGKGIERMRMSVMKQFVKCCLAVVLGFAVVGCSKESSGGSGGGGSGKLREHKGVQLWKHGPYWAETNIGAEKPWDSGYYFWWGDTIGYKRVNDAWVPVSGKAPPECYFKDSGGPLDGYGPRSLQANGFTTAEDALAPAYDAAHVQWGGEWRMPTIQELSDLVSKCDCNWTTMNGMNGYLVRGRGTYASSSIFLPAAGCGAGTMPPDTGQSGYYWSSNPDRHYFAYECDFTKNGIRADRSEYCSNIRGRGFSIRPVRGGPSS